MSCCSILTLGEIQDNIPILNALYPLFHCLSVTSLNYYQSDVSREGDIIWGPDSQIILELDEVSWGTYRGKDCEYTLNC